MNRQRQAIANRGDPGSRRNQRAVHAPAIAPPGDQEQRGHVRRCNR